MVSHIENPHVLVYFFVVLNVLIDSLANTLAQCSILMNFSVKGFAFGIEFPVAIDCYHNSPAGDVSHAFGVLLTSWKIDDLLRLPFDHFALLERGKGVDSIEGAELLLFLTFEEVLLILLAPLDMVDSS